MIGAAGQKRIPASFVEDFILGIPPPDEQQAIANYLDRKTAAIDTLIAKKEQQIALLQEQRTAVINQAVTKGLDPNAPMKDSGIPWLGRIPAHWEVVRLKWLIRDSLQYGANESAELVDTNLPRYIRITDFYEDGTLRQDTFRSLAEEKANGYYLDEGDILFARSGATVGKTFQFKNYSGKACFAGYLIRARPNPESITSDFLYFYTKSGAYAYWKNSIFIQATIQNIGADKYQNLEIPLPPVNEQQEITDHIEQRLVQISKAESRLSQQIELMKEYRTAVISAAVTGKIDVRQEA
jgi:restriction endonuclease S subunit